MKRINWTYIIVGVILSLILMIPAWRDSTDAAYIPVRFFTRAGEMNRDGLRIFTDTITITPSAGVAIIDVSAAGFTYIQSVNVIAERNTATATSVAQVAIKSYTNTAITVNVTEGNANLVTILGISVLGGAATIFSTTDVKLHVFAIGK